MVYDVYIMKHGTNYYKKYHLRGSKKKFDDFHVILSFYKKYGIIDRFYMFELSPEDTENTEGVEDAENTEGVEDAENTEGVEDA